MESRASILLAKLKMTPAMGGMDVELIFRTTGGSHQPRSEELVRELLERYPAVHPVYLSLKTLLSKGSIGDPGKGGLTSLSLLLMIVSVVQNQYFAAFKLQSQSPKAQLLSTGFPSLEDPNQPEASSSGQSGIKQPTLDPDLSILPKLPPGKVLLDFLFWFGHRFNFAEFAVSVNTKQDTQSPVYVSKPAKGSTLSVIHPCNPTIITTKAFKHTDAFKEWCKLTLNSLYATCTCQDLKGTDRHLGIPMIRFGHLKTQAALCRPSYDPTLHRPQTDFALRFQGVPLRPPVHEESKSLSEVKLPCRRKLSSRSQTFEAKSDPTATPLDFVVADRSGGYLLRRTLFCSTFNPPTSLKFVN